MPIQSKPSSRESRKASPAVRPLLVSTPEVSLRLFRGARRLRVTLTLRSRRRENREQGAKVMIGVAEALAAALAEEQRASIGLRSGRAS